MKERILDLLMDNEKLPDGFGHLLVPDPKVSSTDTSFIWCKVCEKCGTDFRIYKNTEGWADFGKVYSFVSQEDGGWPEQSYFTRAWMPCTGFPWLYHGHTLFGDVFGGVGGVRIEAFQKYENGGSRTDCGIFLTADLTGSGK